MKKKPDHEIDFCKNLINDVLKEHLKIERCPDQDAYRFSLFGIIDRELMLQGSIQPIINHLENLKEGLCRIFDKTIYDLLERNRG